MVHTSLLEQRLQEKLEAGKKGANPGDLFVIEDALMFMSLGAQSLSQDEFSKCFEPKSSVLERKPTGMFYILWIIGAMIRYGVLFPLRLFVLSCGLSVFLVSLSAARLFSRPDWERWIFTGTCKLWLFSYGAIIRHHGRKPRLSRPHVFVANHTSFTDFIVLSSHEYPHGVVAQHHGGLFGVFMRGILELYGSLTFNRNEQRDREKMTDRIKKHISNPNQFAPLLIFPEGTCVNNESTVLFHKGVFELNCVICPVGIKYNKRLLDPYWNTREQTFTQHCVYLMTRWLMMVDVYWLPPNEMADGETGIEFADRVKAQISHAAGLKNRSWNGYLKNVMRALDRERMHKSSQSKYAGYLKVVNVSSDSVNNLSGNNSSSESTNERAKPINIDTGARKPCADHQSKSYTFGRRKSLPTSYSHSHEFPQWLPDTTITDAKNNILLSSSGLSSTSAHLSSLKEQLVANCNITKQPATPSNNADDESELSDI